MRSCRDTQQELFSFVKIDRLDPSERLLRKIDRYMGFSFIHEHVDPIYSDIIG